MKLDINFGKFTTKYNLNRTLLNITGRIRKYFGELNEKKTLHTKTYGMQLKQYLEGKL
jgi:hypothetical protein